MTENINVLGNDIIMSIAKENKGQFDGIIDNYIKIIDRFLFITIGLASSCPDFTKDFEEIFKSAQKDLAHPAIFTFMKAEIERKKRERATQI
jgi:hypothetical protein